MKILVVTEAGVGVEDHQAIEVDDIQNEGIVEIMTMYIEVCRDILIIGFRDGI